MDRSFLSQPAVIAASRRFVCVRLMTYESQEEGEFLKSFNVTRSGELENTVFAVLSSDGKRQLARAARSARQTFGDAPRMAAALNRIADEAGVKQTARAVPELPAVANVRLAIDVASCDNQPLVVVVAPDEATRKTLEERLRPLAWGERFLGRFIYTVASAPEDLAGIDGLKPRAGVLVVQSDRFGLKGTILRQAGPEASRDELAKCLAEGLARFRGEAKSFSAHVRAGKQQGVLWQTRIPVTDPMEQRARQSGRGS